MAPHAMNPLNVDNTTTFGALTVVEFRAGVELRGGVNLLRDALKLDNRVTRVIRLLMKLLRDASKH
jgi:hypothetical protein